MKKEEKELLLLELCSRLPYGVIIEHEGNLSRLDAIFMCDSISISSTSMDKKLSYNLDLNEFKPYLYPLSSMTEEQLNELKEYSGLKYSASLLELVNWTAECTTLEFWLEETPAYIVIKVFDWLNRNHFDYRDLITRGLAIDCANLNIY